jgi:hypothetical protein
VSVAQRYRYTCAADTRLHITYQPTPVFTSPLHLRHPENAMPSGRPNGGRGAHAGRTPSGRGSARRRTASNTTPAFDNLEATPQRRLNFGNLDTFSASKFSITTADEKKLLVRVYIISRHLAIVIPAYGQDGWIDNLANGIVLAKSIGMTGFKLANGVGGADNRFGYYKFFENALDAMTALFDDGNNDVFKEGTTIGKSDPTATPPKVSRRCLTRASLRMRVMVISARRFRTIIPAKPREPLLQSATSPSSSSPTKRPILSTFCRTNKDSRC